MGYSICSDRQVTSDAPENQGRGKKGNIMSSKTAHVSLDLDDVRHAGSVGQAIEKWCKDSDTTSCGTIGPSFSTSGPGSGWSTQHDVGDFAERAFNEGAMYYLDTDDGRLASRDEEPDAKIEWTDDSVVEMVCPSVEDAMEYPVFAAEMAQAVIDYHGAESDKKKWAALITAIQLAASAMGDISADDF